MYCHWEITCVQNFCTIELWEIFLKFIMRFDPNWQNYKLNKSAKKIKLIFIKFTGILFEDCLFVFYCYYCTLSLNIAKNPCIRNSELAHGAIIENSIVHQLRSDCRIGSKNRRLSEWKYSLAFKPVV